MTQFIGILKQDERKGVEGILIFFLRFIFLLIKFSQFEKKKIHIMHPKIVTAVGATMGSENGFQRQYANPTKEA